MTRIDESSFFDTGSILSMRARKSELEVESVKASGQKNKIIILLRSEIFFIFFPLIKTKLSVQLWISANEAKDGDWDYLERKASPLPGLPLSVLPYTFNNDF